MDRTVAPSIANKFSLSPINVDSINVNNCKIHYVSGGALPLLKLEFVFKAGTRFQKHALNSTFANALLKEGTLKRNSKRFAEDLDSRGAYIQIDNGKDYSNIIVFCLEKHLEEVLDIVQDMLVNAVIPEDEFEQIRATRSANFEVNSQKVNFVASQLFNRSYYKGHSYGIVAESDDFKKLNLNDIRDFANDFIKGKAFELFISGDLNSSIKKNIQSFVEGLGELKQVDFPTDFVQGIQTNIREQKDSVVQSGVRLAFNGPTKSNSDIHKYSVVNTILGGYFGSRLMQNIREEKGWTYGISSTVLFNQSASTWISAAEVNGEKGEATIDEVKKEIKRLQTELVGNQELERVQNFLSGKLLKSFDGALEQTDRFYAVSAFGLGWDFYHDYLETVYSITAEEILEVANKYFPLEDISTVVVGPKA